MKKIGIIGGMGPLATYDLAEKIVYYKHAKKDQDNVHVYIDCNTDIPDRTQAILYGGKDPLPEIVKSAILLEGIGADVLVMPCNTAHYFYDRIVPFLDVPLLNMPRETAQYLKAEKVQKAAVLSTDGTRKSRIYDRALEEMGIEAIYPSDESQKELMKIIYENVKANICEVKPESISKVLAEVKEKGAQRWILACTELPIAFKMAGLTDCNCVDPTAILARAALKFVTSPEEK